MITEDISGSLFQMSETQGILSLDCFLFPVLFQNILKNNVFIQNSHGHTYYFCSRSTYREMVEIPPQTCKPVTLSTHVTKVITETSDEEILINVTCNTHQVLQKPSGICSTHKVFLAVFWSPTADRLRRQYYSYIREGAICTI